MTVTGPEEDTTARRSREDLAGPKSQIGFHSVVNFPRKMSKCQTYSKARALGEPTWCASYYTFFGTTLVDAERLEDGGRGEGPNQAAPGQSFQQLYKLL